MTMTNPQTYIAYTPRGAGLLCAVVYLVVDRDVYGWWTGYKDAAFASAFFKLEDFYSTEDTVFYATEGSDIYGGWRYDYAATGPELGKGIAVEEEACHILEQLQDQFFSEWLFAPIEPGVAEELAAYLQMELPTQQINIKHRMLNKLDKHDVIWTYLSKDLDMQVINYMMVRWPLEYGRE